MDFEAETDMEPLREIGIIVGIFALVGVSGGLTGAIGFSQLGDLGGTGEQFVSTIVSTLLMIVVIVVMSLIGPVIAVITSLRSADRLGANWTSYIVGLVGSVVGYFVMMFLVASIIVAGLAIVTSGGSSQASGASDGAGTTTPAFQTTTPATSSGAGSSPTPDFGRFLLPIIALVVPSGLAGLGASYIGGRTSSNRNNALTVSELPMRAIAGVLVVVIAIVVVVGGAAILTPGSGIHFGNGDPENIQVSGQQTGFYNDNGQLYSQANLVNTGDVPVKTTATARMVIAGNSDKKFSTTKTITLESGESRTVRINVAKLRNGIVGASAKQQRQINSDNYGFELLIDGETRYSS